MNHLFFVHMILKTNFLNEFSEIYKKNLQKMKQRIAIDMDDVMAFTVQKIVNRYHETFGILLTDAQLAATLVEDAVLPEHRQLVLDWIHTPGFYLDLPVMDDAQRVVYELNKEYEVFVVSAANLIPHSPGEKLQWLAKHFEFISWRNTVFCGHKSVILADYMIDDHPNNLSMFAGDGLLFNSHHNVNDNQFRRVENWKAVEKTLLN